MSIQPYKEYNATNNTPIVSQTQSFLLNERIYLLAKYILSDIAAQQYINSRTSQMNDLLFQGSVISLRPSLMPNQRSSEPIMQENTGFSPQVSASAPSVHTNSSSVQNWQNNTPNLSLSQSSTVATSSDPSQLQHDSLAANSSSASPNLAASSNHAASDVVISKSADFFKDAIFGSHSSSDKTQPILSSTITRPSPTNFIEELVTLMSDPTMSSELLDQLIDLTKNPNSTSFGGVFDDKATKSETEPIFLTVRSSGPSTVFLTREPSHILSASTMLAALFFQNPTELDAQSLMTAMLNCRSIPSETAARDMMFRFPVIQENRFSSTSRDGKSVIGQRESAFSAPTINSSTTLATPQDTPSAPPPSVLVNSSQLTSPSLMSLNILESQNFSPITTPQAVQKDNPLEMNLPSLAASNTSGFLDRSTSQATLHPTANHSSSHASDPSPAAPSSAPRIQRNDPAVLPLPTNPAAIASSLNKLESQSDCPYFNEEDILQDEDQEKDEEEEDEFLAHEDAQKKSS